MAVDGHQRAVGKGALPVFFQRRPHAGGLDLGQIFVDALQVAVFVEQGRRPLFAHFGDAGDVVGVVAHQRLEVGLLRRAQAVVAGGQFRLIVNLAFLNTGGQVHPHLGRNQLESVAVAGQHHRIEAGFFGLPGQRTDDVVGLPAVQLEDGHAKGGHQLLDAPELAAQFLRGGRALRLVVGELLMPEGGRRRVEGDGAVGRAPFLQGAQKGLHKAENAGDILAGGGDGEVALGGDGAVGPMHHRVAVHQHQQRLPFRREHGKRPLRRHHNRLPRRPTRHPYWYAACPQHQSASIPSANPGAL